MIYEADGVYISAKEIEIGRDVTFGRDVDIRCVDKFSLGDRSHLGDNVRVRGRSVKIGADLYHSEGLRVGGGGCDRPWSTLVIGDRCTIHNQFLNLAMPITLGNDVGLSPDVACVSHGFWLSVLRGFPASFAPINIKDGAIIGYRTMVLAGVTIGENCVVGAQSVVTKDLEGNAIYAGSPAKKIRDIKIPGMQERRAWVDHIMHEYQEIAAYHGINPQINVQYPYVTVNGATFHVENLTVTGEEDEETDDFRDAMRRYGLRFYTERPFRSVMRW